MLPKTVTREAWGQVSLLVWPGTDYSAGCPLGQEGQRWSEGTDQERSGGCSTAEAVLASEQLGVGVG